MEIKKPLRNFLPESLSIKTWDDIKSYFEDLINRKINTVEDYQKWIFDKSEIEAVLEEDAAWRYIRMTINTVDKNLSDAYTYFISEIQPKIAPYEDKMNKKLVNSPFFETLKKRQDYAIYFRSVETALKLFREENIRLEAEISELSQKFGSISGAQSIEWEGDQITMQKASTFLKDSEESVRKSTFEKMSERRKQDIESLDKLYSDLIEKRTKLAHNAGYPNYRDYKFDALGRFDYSKEDCFEFHNSIKELIVPLVKQIQKEKLEKLGKSQFKPWDLEVDPEGKKALKPFDSAAELVEGTIKILDDLDPYFADCISTMNDMNHLDLDSKNGKAPGGYNYPLYEIGVPFIFMNAVGTQRDLVTMLHESGHAIHSFLTRDLEITSFKNLPSEVAELASMTMELISMDYWHKFYSDPDDLKRAKHEQLETIIKILPWIAQIDEFQHWIYENYEHSSEERYNKWMELNEAYGTGLVDWSGYEEVIKTSWQRQMHLFEVPFYYIEYGIAQLGAIGIWKAYKENAKKAVKNYVNALKLGYTTAIPDIYSTAGVVFDFGKSNIKELTDFIKEELNKSKTE